MNDITKTIGVYLVDDSVEFTARVSQLIEAIPGMVLRGIAHTRIAAKNHLLDTRIQVFLVDLGLPDGNGTELIACIHEKRPDAAIIVVTIFADDEHVMSSIQAGATGYLLKDSSAEDMANGIRMVSEGGSPISPTIARKVLSLYQQQLPAYNKPLKSLSPRELETLRYIAKGNSLEEVAHAMGLTRATVASHVRGIYTKLEVNTRSEAMLEAVKCGLIKTH
ncbi:MAG: response regulator transcription factor [Gallionella sp.]